MRFAKGLVAFGMVAGVMAVASSANAQLTTFANFGLSNNPKTPTGSFVYTDTYTSGAITSTTTVGSLSVTSGTPYVMTFVTPNGYGPLGAFGTQFIADLTFNATAQGALILNSNGSYSQAYTNITASFTVAPGYIPASGKTNALTLNFGSGTLNFSAGSGAATFQASVSQTGTGAPGVAGYSSDFYDFNNPNSQGAYYQSEQFSISFSGVNTTSGAGPTVATGSGQNVLNSFTADPTGTFSSNPVPAPTPATPGETSAMIGMAMMGAQFGMVRLRRRRTAKNRAA